MRLGFESPAARVDSGQSISPGAFALRSTGVCPDATPIFQRRPSAGNQTILARKPTESQDAMPQGSGNPNATGAVAPAGCYSAYTSGTFDDNYDQDGGYGQITTVKNDGFAWPDGYVLKSGAKV